MQNYLLIRVESILNRIDTLHVEASSPLAAIIKAAADLGYHDAKVTKIGNILRCGSLRISCAETRRAA